MVTEHIEKAFEAYSRNAWSFIGAYLFVALISGLFLGSIYYTYTIFKEAILTFLSIVGVLTFIFSLFVAFFQAGLIKMSQEALKGKTKFKTIFSSSFNLYLKLLGAYILTGIIILVIAFIFIGIPLLSIVLSAAQEIIGNNTTQAVTYTPAIISAFVAMFVGIIVTLLLSLPFVLFSQAAVIDGLGSFSSVKKSFMVVKENYLPFLGLILLLMIISVVIGFIPIIGFIVQQLFIAPIILITYTSFYISKTRKPKPLKMASKRK